MRKMACLVLLAGFSFLCRAGSIGSEANINEVGVSTPCFTGYVSTSGATCSGTVGISGTSVQMSYDAYGVVDAYGVLGVYAQGSINAGAATSGTIPTFGNINATAWFIDTFTFTGTDTCGGVSCAASGDGTVQFQFLINGTDTNNGAFGNVCADVLPGVDTSDIGCYVSVLRGSGEFVTASVPIVFGQAETFTVALDAYGHITNFSSGVNFTANFADTATLAGFVVDDAAGNQLTSFSVTSGSGTNYPDTTLPEPSSIVMVLSAISLLALWRRAYRSKAREALV